jgi:hypothetical protein
VTGIDALIPSESNRSEVQGVCKVAMRTRSIVIENTWSDREAETLAKGKSEAIRLAAC